MKRELTPEEIKDIISEIQPNPHIPSDTAKSIVENIKKNMVIRQ
jgi:ribosomal protein S13